MDKSIQVSDLDGEELHRLLVSRGLRSAIPSSRKMLNDYGIESWTNNPAYRSTGIMWLIEDKKVIGQVSMLSATHGGGDLYTTVTIKPADDATREYFKDDPIFQEFGDPWLKFNGITGSRWSSGIPREDWRYPNLYIVDKLYFDMGICHPFFSDVEGFDNYHKDQNKIRIHTSHKSRRRRNSNKIKKVYYAQRTDTSSHNYRR